MMTTSNREDIKNAKARGPRYSGSRSSFAEEESATAAFSGTVVGRTVIGGCAGIELMVFMSFSMF
jgi:hypothetical protein